MFRVPKALAGCTAINKALINPVKEPKSELLFKILIPAKTSTIEIASPPIISRVGSIFALTLIILTFPS